MRTVAPLDGEPLPEHEQVCGAVVMGGPMNVDGVDRYPALASEREWLREAVSQELPVLGVCLGAQLIARALGAEVRPGLQPEIGFAPVAIHDPSDPIVGPLAPKATVLHWHGDVLDLPEGARRLASSAQTETQAFQLGSAWGILFHPEADGALLERWLAEPTMRAEAEAAIGPGAVAGLVTDAARHEADLIRRSTPGFEAFADLVRLTAAIE